MIGSSAAVSLLRERSARQALCAEGSILASVHGSIRLRMDVDNIREMPLGIRMRMSCRKSMAPHRLYVKVVSISIRLRNNLGISSLHAFKQQESRRR